MDIYLGGEWKTYSFNSTDRNLPKSSEVTSNTLLRTITNYREDKDLEAHQ